MKTIDWDRENELCAKRALYRELMKKSEDELTKSDKELHWLTNIIVRIMFNLS